jgi:hypothetical protein
MSSTKLNAHDIRRIAVKAECDPRSVQKYLRSEAVRQLVAARIERALRALDIAQPAGRAA